MAAISTWWRLCSIYFAREIILKACFSTVARRVRVKRERLVNDDLGTFTDFAAMVGRRVANFENAIA